MTINNTFSAPGQQTLDSLRRAVANGFSSNVEQINNAQIVVKIGPTLPTVPEQGQIFYLTTLSGSNPAGLYLYNGTAWQQFTLSSASGASGNSGGGIPIQDISGATVTTLRALSHDTENHVVSFIGDDLQPLEGGGGFTGTLITVEERSNTLPLNTFKALTANSTSFADFQTRVAALTGN